ncbi:hypothetical protein BDW42DRAFT_159043 [Aspergillus taichungensis]|uniref:Uncharacterized protein n=1 Tax=Aspergillus taichungensis TaxID=482145 RepID=A0A2J5I8I7_9EURO|nr:hypothetical protein BDW42DRAFT_159043 [Aspergillus taichungensis]
MSQCRFRRMSLLLLVGPNYLVDAVSHDRGWRLDRSSIHCILPALESDPTLRFPFFDRVLIHHNTLRFLGWPPQRGSASAAWLEFFVGCDDRFLAQMFRAYLDPIHLLSSIIDTAKLTIPVASLRVPWILAQGNQYVNTYRHLIHLGIPPQPHAQLCTSTVRASRGRPRQRRHWCPVGAYGDTLTGRLLPAFAGHYTTGEEQGGSEALDLSCIAWACAGG